jgi:hypothetical protein
MEISGLSLGSPKTKCHLDVGLMERHKVYYKGEGGGFPQIRTMLSLLSPSCPWLVLTPKVFTLRINHLVLVLNRFVWVVETYQFFLVPSRNSSTPFYPSKVLRTKECASTPYSSVVFSLDSHLSPSRSWEHVIYVVVQMVLPPSKASKLGLQPSLKNSLHLFYILVHCVAHKTNLVTFTFSNLPIVGKIETLLASVYTYFSHNPKRNLERSKLVEVMGTKRFQNFV